MFITDVLSEYCARKTNLKTSSRLQLGYSVAALERWHRGALLVEQVTESLLARWVSDRRREVSPATVHRNLSNVVSLLRFASRKLKSGCAVPDLDPITVPRSIPVAWSVDQVSAILKVCRSLKGNMRRLPITRADWWSALILFLYDSGCRIKAAMSVSPIDFDLGTRTVILRGEHSKTGETQIVDIAGDTAAAIKRLIDSQAGTLLPLSVWPYPWAARKLWIDFHEILEASGLPSGRYIGFHRIRKTHATQTVALLGWEHARVALGHTSEKMTRRYVDLRQLPRAGHVLPRPE